MNDTVDHLGDKIRPHGGQLVDPTRTVHDEGPRRSEPSQYFGNSPHERRRVDAHHLGPRAGRIRQRAEDVEDRSRRQLRAHRRGVSHGGVMRRGEEKAEAELVDRLRDPFGPLLEAEAERLEDVGRAARRGDGTVPVLGDRGAGRRGDQCGGGRDVDRVGAVAPRPRRVHEILAPRIDGEDMRSHRLGAACDLVRRLALRAQRDQEAPDLRGRRLAEHDLVHHGTRLRALERLAVQQLRDGSLNHRFTKFRAIWRPWGVRTDSGWNCTPWTFSVRWRTAMISPSAAVAQTSRPGAREVAASEW